MSIIIFVGQVFWLDFVTEWKQILILLSQLFFSPLVLSVWTSLKICYLVKSYIENYNIVSSCKGVIFFQTTLCDNGPEDKLFLQYFLPCQWNFAQLHKLCILYLQIFWLWKGLRFIVWQRIKLACEDQKKKEEIFFCEMVMTNFWQNLWSCDQEILFLSVRFWNECIVIWHYYWYV